MVRTMPRFIGTTNCNEKNIFVFDFCFVFIEIDWRKIERWNNLIWFYVDETAALTFFLVLFFIGLLDGWWG